MSGCRGSVQTLGPGRVKACWPAGARAPSGARERPPPPRRPWGGDRARGESLAGRGLERGRGRPRAQTWRSGRAVHLQLVDRLRLATDARPAASAGAAAPTCGVRVRRHHLPARLEPSAWPGPSPGGGECAGSYPGSHRLTILWPQSLGITALSVPRTLLAPKTPSSPGHPFCSATPGRPRSHPRILRHPILRPVNLNPSLVPHPAALWAPRPISPAC